jgi:hypothetical protein
MDMNILEAIALVAVGIALGYAFRAWIGKELVGVKAELAELKSKVARKL